MNGVERATYKVVVGGADISPKIEPILMDLSVSLSSGSNSDSATITLDDRKNRIKFPRDDEDIAISLGYTGKGMVEVFRGKVNDITCAGSRGSGETLSITASGMDTKGKAKQPRDKHYDNMKVADILSDAAKAAGYSDVSVDDEIGKIVIPYVGQIGTSLIHLGQKFARDFGGTFKIMGDKVVMIKRGAGRSASGKPLISIEAVRGENLIDWSITPVIGRPRHTAVEAEWYDKTKAKMVKEKADTKDKKAKATGRARYTAASEPEAKAKSKALAEESDRNKGAGTITINGDPRAMPEAKCILRGARPGIDGTYTLEAVSHSFNGRGGYTTQLTLRQPEGGAGEDNRGA